MSNERILTDTIRAQTVEIRALKDEILDRARRDQGMIDREYERSARLLSALRSLKDFADNIQKNHPVDCAHGNGYSLLGQLAQQVSNDGHYALEAYEKGDASE